MECAHAAPDLIANSLRHWATQTGQLRFDSIATVYVWSQHARLPHPMLALRATPQAPAQFASLNLGALQVADNSNYSKKTRSPLYE